MSVFLRRGGILLILLPRAVVAGAPRVVGHVPAAPLQLEGRGGNKLLERPVARRAGFERALRNPLHDLERPIAVQALIFINRHDTDPSLASKNETTLPNSLSRVVTKANHALAAGQEGGGPPWHNTAYLSEPYCECSIIRTSRPSVNRPQPTGRSLLFPAQPV